MNCTCANRIDACSAKYTIGHTGIPADIEAMSAWFSTDGGSDAGCVAMTGSSARSPRGCVQFRDEAVMYPTATRLAATLMNVPMPGPRAPNVGRDVAARSDSMRALRRA